jgi:hypothetical protein
MAIDLTKLREKHEKFQGSTTNSTDFLNNFYQIPEGSNSVRIIPWKDDDKEFYAETKIHRVPTGEGNNIKNVHCRKVHGEACPLCDLYYSLWKTGRQEDEDLARKIKPRDRYYMNILDRESGQVKILSVGIILFKKIVNAILDEDFGDITDPQNGHDFKIVKEMEAGSPWPKYDQSQPRPKSEVLGTKAQIASYMESLHEIHDLVKLEDYDEVKEIVNSLTGVATDGKSTPQNEETPDGDYLTKLKS